MIPWVIVTSVIWVCRLIVCRFRIKLLEYDPCKLPGNFKQLELSGFHLVRVRFAAEYFHRLVMHVFNSSEEDDPNPNLMGHRYFAIYQDQTFYQFCSELLKCCNWLASVGDRNADILRYCECCCQDCNADKPVKFWCYSLKSARFQTMLRVVVAERECGALV